jgi:hypothetical protein
MKIHITNCSNPLLRQEARNALNFWAEKLLGSRMSKNVSVSVRFKDGILKEEKIFADMGIKLTGKLPRSFDVRIESSLGRKRVLMALAHEFTHIKQYVKGELRDANDKTRWMNQTFDNSSTDYYDSPWEIEALGREVGLYIQWLRFKREMNARGKLL